MVETISQIYSTHTFAVTLILVGMVALLFIKILSFTSKSIFLLSIVGVAYYFLGMSPETRADFNNQAKKVMAPIFGSSKYDTASTKVFKKRIEEKMDEVQNIIREED